MAHAQGRGFEQIKRPSAGRLVILNGVKNRLRDAAFGISRRQQRFPVIGHVLEADVLLLDEQAPAANGILTLKIEELIYELKNRYSIGIVSHSIQQGFRALDNMTFLYRWNG